MLTKDEVLDTMDAHITAMMSMVSRGYRAEGVAMLKGLTDLVWEVTRPDATMRTKDVSHTIPDDYRSEIASLVISVVIDEEGSAIMAWGEAIDHDGNNLASSGKVSKEMHGAVMTVIDEQMDAHFADVDRSKVMTMQEVEEMADKKKGPMTTAHIEVTKDAIEQAAAEFNDEFDRLFETWGGGEQ